MEGRCLEPTRLQVAEMDRQTRRHCSKTSSLSDQLLVPRGPPSFTEGICFLHVCLLRLVPDPCTSLLISTPFVGPFSWSSDPSVNGHSNTSTFSCCRLARLLRKMRRGKDEGSPSRRAFPSLHLSVLTSAFFLCGLASSPHLDICLVVYLSSTLFFLLTRPPRSVLSSFETAGRGLLAQQRAPRQHERSKTEQALDHLSPTNPSSRRTSEQERNALVNGIKSQGGRTRRDEKLLLSNPPLSSNGWGRC